MQGTAPGLRTDSATRLAELERQRPEWQTWLTLLGETERALRDPGWRAPLNDRELEGVLAVTSDRAPLLHGMTLAIDADRVEALVRRLASKASPGESYRPSSVDATRLVLAALRQDLEAIEALASGAGIDRGVLTSIAHLAAFPLLQSCGRELENRIPRSWKHGYCPICAAWPILAERRGLDRTRRLRCGRCGGEWQVQWLCCIYCGEREHEHLASLVPDEQGERLNVETCSSCRGYLKSVATLQRIPPFELLLQDLETVELDLVALDRGYGRPEESGFPLEIRLR
jgi:FdhE protein